MSKTFVFGDTKVAQTAQEIREQGDQTAKTENKQADATSVVVTESMEQAQAAPEKSEKDESSAAETSASNQKTVAQEPARTDKPTGSFAVKGKKTENGIVVNVPMDDYMQLTMMKFQTGRTLKDLALQAIHEFVERNK